MKRHLCFLDYDVDIDCETMGVQKKTRIERARIEQPMALPILRCLPASASCSYAGCLSKLCFASVLPIAFSQEKDRPGIPVV